MLKERCPRQPGKDSGGSIMRSYSEWLCASSLFHPRTKVVGELCHAVLIPIVFLPFFSFWIDKITVHTSVQKQGSTIGLLQRWTWSCRGPTPPVDFEIRRMGRIDGRRHVVISANRDRRRICRYGPADELTQRVVAHHPKDSFPNLAHGGVQF